MKAKPKFQLPVLVEIENFKTKEKFSLRSFDDSFSITDEILEEIKTICNQEEIYEILFKERLKGRKYEKQDALSFVDFANTGWTEYSHFIFIILHKLRNNIVGAVDIKSDDLQNGEVGYWLSKNHGGLMTNAVSTLAEIARFAGYKNLFGFVKKENIRSQNVLLRAGFRFTRQSKKENKVVYKYTLKLS